MTVFVAGSDTVSLDTLISNDRSLRGFRPPLSWSHSSLAMLHYPEIQVRARREIEAVTGGSRLPGFEDRASLPYIELIMAEIFRWATPVPLGKAQPLP
jgi:hypothetical protein